MGATAPSSNITIGFHHGVKDEVVDAVAAFCKRIPFITTVDQLHVEIVPTNLRIASIQPTADCVVTPTSVICSGEARLLSFFAFGNGKPIIRVAATHELGNTTTVTTGAIAHALAHYEQVRDRKQIRRRGVKMRALGIVRQVANINFCRFCDRLMRVPLSIHAENPFCVYCLRDRVALATQGQPPKKAVIDGKWIRFVDPNDCTDPSWPA